MKTIIALLLAVAGVMASEPTPEELKNVKTVTIEDVSKDRHKFIGSLVRLKFAYRDADIVKGKKAANSYSSAVSDDSFYIGIDFPESALGVITALPTEKKRTLFLYARISEDRFKSLRAEILGKEIKTDREGPKLHW